MILTADVVGGYDDNVIAAAGMGAGAVPTAMGSGSTGSLNTTLEYFRGNTSRALRVESTGNLHAYPNYLETPAAGGGLAVDGRMNLAPNLTLAVSERAAYEPLFNVFLSDSPSPAGIDGAALAVGLFERRSLSSNASASIERRWTRRDSTSISYSWRSLRFMDDDHGNSSLHNVLAQHRITVARGVRIRADYGYLDGDYLDYRGASRPRQEHRMEAGSEIEKAFSRFRRLACYVGAGASYVESVDSMIGRPYHHWMPVGSATATFALSPRWMVDGGYRRGFSALAGITDEVYATGMAFLSTGGRVTSRIDMRAGGSYNSGTPPRASGARGTYDVYRTALQLRFWVTRTIALSAGYAYYYQRFSNPAVLPAGFPTRYDRQAVHVGLTMVIPLVGTPLRSPLAPR